MTLEYPTAVWVPLIDTATLQTTNISDLDTITRTTLNPASAIPVDGIPRILSNLNSMPYHETADDTAFDTTYQWTPETTGDVEKMFINFAILMNMTARTSNSATFETVQITLTESQAGNVLYDRLFATGFSAQDAAGEVRMFIVAQPVDNQSIHIQAGVPINIRIQTSFSQTATNTVEFGLPVVFPTTIDSNTKFLYEPGIMFYITRTER